MSEAGPPRLHERPWLWLGALGGLAAVAALVVVVVLLPRAATVTARARGPARTSARSS